MDMLEQDIVFTISNNSYITIRASLFPFQFSMLKPKSYVISTTDVGLVLLQSSYYQKSNTKSETCHVLNNTGFFF